MIALLRVSRRRFVSVLLLAVLAGWMLDTDWAPNMCDPPEITAVRR